MLPPNLPGLPNSVPSDRQNCLTCLMWCTDLPISLTAKAPFTWPPRITPRQAVTTTAQSIYSQQHPLSPPSSPTALLMPHCSNRNPSPRLYPPPQNLLALKVQITAPLLPKDSPPSPLELFHPTPFSGLSPRCPLTTPQMRRVGWALSCSQTFCVLPPAAHLMLKLPHQHLPLQCSVFC